MRLKWSGKEGEIVELTDRQRKVKGFIELLFNGGAEERNETDFQKVMKKMNEIDKNL